MATDAGFHILVATDGSPQARAALATAVGFPWPRGARATAVVARGEWVAAQAAAEWPAPVWSALGEGLERIRRGAHRALARRWPAADVVLVDQPPIDGILAQARHLRARAIVLGSRGHGVIGRFVLGSVSRGVVRRADCPVLVVKRRARPVRHLLVAIDGSPNAQRAVAFVAGLTPPRGGRVTLLRVVEPVRVPSMALVPASIRSAVSGEAAKLTGEWRREAQGEAEAAARRLGEAGWSARPVVRLGVPLLGLLEGVAAAGADVLVLGARGVGGVERLLLGSVAEGALTRASVPVLIVK